MRAERKRWQPAIRAGHAGWQSGLWPWLLAVLLVVPCLRADEPASPEVPTDFKFVTLIGKLHEEKLGWQDNWKSKSTERTAAADAALAVATCKDLSRAQLKEELAKSGEKYKRVTRNLDVGRHQLVKWLFAQAAVEANRRLAEQNLQPLEKVTTVNSGGTGDFTRDVDVTVFAGDDARETVFFEALRDLAQKQGLTVEADPKLGVKSGINIPQIEVACHRGVNDLPDARYASDVQRFALDYRAALEKQARNPEAYFGYGFEIEVQGRRSLSFKPGQTLVQEFECSGGGVQYTGNIATYQREVRGFLHGAIGQRYRRAQASSHITNCYLQAFRHDQGGDHDLTKGALKYAGRALEQLCEYHGFKTWPELVAEDRIQLLARIFPPGYIDEPGNRKRLQNLATAMDVSYLTYQSKKVPTELNGMAGNGKSKDTKTPVGQNPGEVAHPTGGPQQKPITVDQAMAESCDGLALSFMQRAAAATAGAVAQEMIDPPHLSARFLAEVNRTDSRWNSMNEAEREVYARQRDDNYRACISAAAMENMLAQVEQLMILDLPEFNKRGTLPGTEAAQQMLEMASPNVRPLLEAAMEHAAASVMLTRAQDPQTKARATAAMEECRRKLEAVLHKPAPGTAVIAAAAATTPEQFVKDRTARRLGPWGQAAEETAQRLKQHIEESFPPRDYEAFKFALQQKGVRGYIGERAVAELCQLGNAVDGLKLIEMYQNGAASEEVRWYLTTTVLSRCYWGMGFLIQAWQVKTAQDVKELGKNIIFDACQRVIPGLGTFKMIFDIERGLVVITVGYTINQLNADLIDALYTGEAGRTNDGMAGKVAGSIRDSGVCVLPKQLVLKKQDAKQAWQVSIDRSAVYRYYFQQWVSVAGGRQIEYDNLNGRQPLPGPAGNFLTAHDALVQKIQDAYDKDAPGWFGKTATGYKFDDKQLDSAFRAFREQVRPRALVATNTVINTLAPRQYFKDGEDVIAEGLRQRLVDDFLLGLVETWKTHRSEQMLAVRQVEYMAGVADKGLLAQGLYGTLPGGQPMPKFHLEVTVTPPPDASGVIDGSEPVALASVLRCRGPVPSDMSDVVVEVKDAPFELPPGESQIRPGLIVTQKMVVRAVAGGGSGTVLDEVALTLKLRLPDDLITLLKAAKRVDITYNGPTSCSISYQNNGQARNLNGRIGVGADPVNFKTPQPEVKASWSGNSFTIDVDKPYDKTEDGGRHTVSRARTHLTGTLNLAKKTVSVNGQ
ncbi:MAG: hypothetical protein WCI73_04225, partial [Phycisphaerae bacterium]